MRKILIFAPTFLPGFKGGGPIQSINNITSNLSKYFTFFVFTSDRDKGDESPYTNIEKDRWIDKKNYKVLYTKNTSIKNIKQNINKIHPDVIYLNSFFSWEYSIKIVLMNHFSKKKRKILLAPRGEFDEGALKIKKNKKYCFIFLYKLLNLDKNIVWHATTEDEKKNIKKIFTENIQVNISSNLTSNYSDYKLEKREKSPGVLKIIFISRITEKKNLMFILQILKKVKTGNVFLSIYGPIENEIYWQKCESMIKELPKNVKVEYFGEVNHSKINEIFSKNHFFFFPTFGENYGHVISEALISGCPVVISKETPWLDLEKENVGWDIELNNFNKFIEVLENCINMTQDDFDKMSFDAFNYAKRKSDLNSNKKDAQRLFS